MNNSSVAYCLNCKKFFNENLTDSQGFICCPNCQGAYRFNVMQLCYYPKEGYDIQIQDSMIINFRDRKEFNKIIKLMRELIRRSKR